MVAAFLVVVSHATYYTMERLHAPVSGFWHGGGNGVDIFFAISGFVMVVSSQRLMGQPDGWKTFAWQRIIRIAPMYWLATTLKLATIIGAGAIVLHAQFEWKRIVGSYLFVPTRNADGWILPLLGVGWTLVFEMLFYALFTMALFFRANVYWFVGIVLAVLASLSAFKPEHGWAVWYYCDPIVLEFFWGMLVAGCFLRGCGLTARVSVVVLIISAAILLMPAWAWKFDFHRPITVGLPAALLLLAAVSLENRIGRLIPEWLMFLGAASYSIYLFHPMLAPAAPMLLNRLQLPIWILSVLLAIVIAITGGVTAYWLIERPMTKRIRQITKQRATAPAAMPKEPLATSASAT